MIEMISKGQQATASPSNPELPHVLLVLDQFPETLGGGERIALRLAQLLPHYGYRASILTFSIHPRCPIASEATCPIYLLPLTRTYDANAVFAAFALRNFLMREQIRLVQTFFESSDLWAGFVVKAFSKAKLIWSRRDMGILRTRKHLLGYRWMSRFPDAVFAVSEQVRQECILTDGIEPERVFTIYNGLDLSRWMSVPRADASKKAPSVTTVGNIRRVKGHDLFIRAAAQIVKRIEDVQFSIAGAVLDPQYFDELQSLVEELHLTGHFRFLGGDTDLPQLLANSQIFVLPSRSEGFSNAIIEAMASSLPVVATRVGGNGEAVVDGASGYLVPPEDVDALASAIERLLLDPLKASRMGAAGRQLVVERFTADAMMKSIVERYKLLLSAD
jgi:glycosyltransferase involved in cell wall biosynthesis